MAGSGGGAARVTAFTATSIVVADMIGIGVFTSLGFQVLGIQSGFALVMLWVVGGIAALCGALCYAELAAAYPRSGGEYNYLGRVYHPAVGFMTGWLSATVGFAAPIALAAIALGAYFEGAAPGLVSELWLAIGVVWAVTLVNLSGVRFASVFQNVFTIFKILLISVFIVAVLAIGEPQPISFAPTAADFDAMMSASFAISLVFVMYSYSGWNASTYIAGEMENPQRDAPRSLFFGTLIVAGFYVALNAVFLYTTPIAAMTGQVDVARVVGAHVFGEAGGRIVAGLICFGLISAISALVWIGPRVTQSMGRDLPALSLLGRTSANGAPTVAILLQAVIVTLLIFTQSFEGVLQFTQFSLTLSSFAAVLGVMVLRWRRPDLPRPYRAWGYPATPLVFMAITGFMMIHQLREKPLESLLGVGLLLLGLLVYWLASAASSSRRVA